MRRRSAILGLAEMAVHGGNTEDFGNPLRLRRPLEHGVRVMVAHCASLGQSPDLDIGQDGPLLQRSDWHTRLLNGSDYPLPGILPLFSLQQLERRGFIEGDQAKVLSKVRDYNPLLFDFVLKRTLSFNGNSFGSTVFQTRGFFQGQRKTSGA